MQNLQGNGKTFKATLRDGLPAEKNSFERTFLAGEKASQTETTGIDEDELLRKIFDE